jgi:hypothetical protein
MFSLSVIVPLMLHAYIQLMTASLNKPLKALVMEYGGAKLIIRRLSNILNTVL